MKILITGSTGQLARELQSELAGTGKLLALGHNALDLAVPEQIREQVRLLRPDLIINAAAYTAVDPAETHREQAFAVNARGPQVLAEEAARLGVPLIHYSTDYVFDGRKTEPYDEHDTPNPLGVYGASKLAGEQAIRAVGGEHLILRTSWVYSRHGKNFLLTMQRLLQERDALSVVSDEVGAPTWAATIARVTAELVRKRNTGQAGPSGLYHHRQRRDLGTALPAASPSGCARRTPACRDHPDPVQGLPDRGAAAAEFAAQLRTAAADWGVQLPDWETALHECCTRPRPRSRQRAPAGRRRPLSQLRLQLAPSGCHEPRR